MLKYEDPADRNAMESKLQDLRRHLKTYRRLLQEDESAKLYESLQKTLALIQGAVQNVGDKKNLPGTESTKRFWSEALAECKKAASAKAVELQTREKRFQERLRQQGKSGPSHKEPPVVPRRQERRPVRVADLSWEPIEEYVNQENEREVVKTKLGKLQKHFEFRALWKPEPASRRQLELLQQNAGNIVHELRSLQSDKFWSSGGLNTDWLELFRRCDRLAQDESEAFISRLVEYRRMTEKYSEFVESRQGSAVSLKAACTNLQMLWDEAQDLDDNSVLNAITNCVERFETAKKGFERAVREHDRVTDTSPKALGLSSADVPDATSAKQEIAKYMQQGNLLIDQLTTQLKELRS